MWLKLSAIYTATFQNLLPRFLSVQKNRDRLELGPRLTGKREAACLSLSMTKLRRGLSSQVEGQPGHREVPDTAGRHRWWGLQKANGWYIVPRTTMKKHVCQRIPEAWGLGDVTKLPRGGSAHTRLAGSLWMGLWRSRPSLGQGVNI